MFIRRRMLSATIIALLLTSTLIAAFNIQPVSGSGTIYIRADGSIDPPTAPIQRDGDIYTFSDNINGSIIVERNNIIIDGANFTLQGPGDVGITLENRYNVTVRHMNIMAFSIIGIDLMQSSSCSIIGNSIANSYCGIQIFRSSNNRIVGNSFTNNGLLTTIGSLGNVVTDNIVNGKPLVHLENITSHNVSDAGQVILINCDSVRVENLNLSAVTVGLQMVGTNNSKIINNSIMSNVFSGIWLDYGSNNSLVGNNIRGNTLGIMIRQSSNNSISWNNVTENIFAGVGMFESSNNRINGNNIANSDCGVALAFSSNYNTVSGNNITNNRGGIWLYDSSNNIIYHNNFINNNQQFLDPPGYVNIWDDGYPSGGNYWSDYEARYPEAEELDGSGIWDTPYVIDDNNRDNHPLVNPWRPTHIWPMFQHDAQRTGRSPYVGPKSQEPEVQIFSSEGYSDFASAVAIGADGTIYSKAISAQGTGLYAFNPDGTEKWFVPIPIGGYPTIGPEGTIYAKSGEGVIAVNPDGTLKWEKYVSSHFTRQHFVIGEESTLYFIAGVTLPNGSSAAPCLVALNVNGNVVWLYDIRGDQVWFVAPDYEMESGGTAGISDTGEVSSPSIGHDGTIYFGSHNVLYAFYPNGTEKWRKTFETASQNIQFAPVISSDSIYVTVNHVFYTSRWHSCLYAMNLDGTIMWNITVTETFFTHQVMGPDGTLYVFTWSYPTIRAIFDLIAVSVLGEIEWILRDIGGYGTPIVDAEGNVFATMTGSSGVAGFSPQGEVLWQTSLSLLSPGEAFYHTCLALNQNGTLFVPGKNNLYAIRDLPPTYVHGVDVSHHQGDIAWPEVYGAGYRFAFAKASEGDGWVDPKFQVNMDGGSGAGLLMGAYHLARPDLGNDAADEATHFLSVAQDYVTEGYLRPALHLAFGASELGKEALSSWVHTWMATVTAETGVEPILQVNSDYANNHLDPSVAEYDLWITHWTYDPDASPDTGIWDTWSFWQYSNTGSVPGISGDVFLNLFNGDNQRLQDTFIIGCGRPVLISPLEISPGPPYYVGDTLTATFTIRNDGDAAITLDKLLVGGRFNGDTLPDGEFPDFTFQTVTLQPGQTHEYEGTLELVEAGNYHFFVAYYIENPTAEEKTLLDENNWNTCIGLDEGLTNVDRTRQIEAGMPPFSPYPYGYGFDNRGVVDLSEGCRWAIFTNTFDLTGVDTTTQEEWVGQLRFGEGGNCYGMAASSLMEYRHPNYDSFLQDQGEQYLYYLGEPPVKGGAWDAGSNIIERPVLKHIIEFQISQVGIPRDQKIVGTEAVLDALLTQLPDEMYVLCIYDEGTGHALVPFRIETVTPDQEYHIYVYDSNHHYDQDHPDQADRAIRIWRSWYHRWYWEYDLGWTTWSGPSWWGVFGDNSIELIPVAVMYNEGERLRLPGTGDALEAVVFLTGDADLFLTDSAYNIAGLINDSVVEEIPDVALVFPLGILPDEHPGRWQPTFRIYEDTGLRYTIEGLSTTNEEYSLLKIGTRYTIKVRALIGDEKTEIHICGNGTTITIFGQCDEYTIAAHRAIDDTNVFFTASNIPSSSDSIHQYNIDWDALSAGEEGVTVLVDADGDGVFEHSFTTGNVLSSDEFLLKTETTVDLDPDSLNLYSTGRWVTAYIEFPEGYDVADIDVSSIMLNGTVPVDPSAPWEIGDYDDDGVPDLMVKFDRAQVTEYILANVNIEERFTTVTLTVTGYLYDGTAFQGSDIIKIIWNPPRRGNTVNTLPI